MKRAAIFILILLTIAAAYQAGRHAGARDVITESAIWTEGPTVYIDFCGNLYAHETTPDDDPDEGPSTPSAPSLPTPQPAPQIKAKGT